MRGLEAENAALRQQLTILQRKVRGRVRFTNRDRLFFVLLYRWFPSILAGDAGALDRAGFRRNLSTCPNHSVLGELRSALYTGMEVSVEKSSGMSMFECCQRLTDDARLGGKVPEVDCRNRSGLRRADRNFFATNELSITRRG